MTDNSCNIYFAGGDPIKVMNSRDEILCRMEEAHDVGIHQIEVRATTGYAVVSGTIFTKHIVAVVNNR